jgi:hypothetical protein
MYRERGLDAEFPLTVTGANGKDFFINTKAARWGRFLAKRRKRKENLSGKAMQDEVLAHARTHGLKKSESLEEG